MANSHTLCGLVRTPSVEKITVICLPTYSMVQSPSWAANWFAASQEIPRISWNPKVHYRTHKRPPPVPILGQPNPVHIPTSHPLQIRPNIIHSSTPRSPHYSLSLRFPSWAANWFAASQEIPRISRNPKVHYRTHNRPPPVSILGQPSPVHIPTSHLLGSRLHLCYYCIWCVMPWLLVLGGQVQDSNSWWWAYKCPKHVEQIIGAVKHSVAASWFSSLRLNSWTFFVNWDFVTIFGDEQLGEPAEPSAHLYTVSL